MKTMKPKKKENWELARQQAKQMGIVLTQQKDREGKYVCYLNRKARKGWLMSL